MSKYVVNGSLIGYETVEITDDKLLKGDGNIIIVVLDSSTNDKLYNYYTSIHNILISNNKLIVVIVGDESNISKPISTLMSSYRNYNIYVIDNINMLDNDYAEEIIKREPTYEEVQSFIGADITAYAEINTILLGIENLVRVGDIDGLKTFLENHLPSINNFTEIIDYMKTLINTMHSGELQTKLEELKKSVEHYRIEADKYKESYNNKELEYSKVEAELNSAKKELSIVRSKLSELEEQINSKTPVIKNYTELNVSLIKCKTTYIIYFKEISQIPYINSLVLTVYEALNLKRLRAKLLIYDSKVGLTSIYKPLNIVDSNTYMSKRDFFIKSVDKFVVVEPNPVILDDILTYSADPFDVVIIYDRMRQHNDLVVGNNVVKFYVINSSKDFREVQQIFNINDKSFVITRQGSGIGAGVLDIPKIDDYNNANVTDSAKFSKYMKALTSSNKPLIRTILDKARIK